MVGLYSGFKIYPGETPIKNFERLINNLGDICEKDCIILIGGDFNAEPSKVCPKVRLLELWQTDNGLDQLIQNHTKAHLVGDQVQSSLLDLIFTNIKDVSTKTVHSEASDHSLIVASIPSVNCHQEVRFQKKIVTDWRNFNPQYLSSIISHGLSDMNCSHDINVLDRDISMCILAAMNRVIPQRVVHIRRGTDVVNYSIEAMKKKRDRMIKKARKTSDIEAMKTVKAMDKAIKKIIKRERDRMIKSKMKDSSPATFWHTINGLLGKSGHEEITILNAEGSGLHGEELAQAFSDFFKGKVDRLIALNNVNDSQTSSDYVPIQPFLETEITEAMSSFKTKRSAGLDGIPLIVLKTCFAALLPSIFQLFKMITNGRGKIPVAWKVAKIKPIFKKGDRYCLENYRPISYLNSISKLFERCVLNRLTKIPR